MDNKSEAISQIRQDVEVIAKRITDVWQVKQMCVKRGVPTELHALFVAIGMGASVDGVLEAFFSSNYNEVKLAEIMNGLAIILGG